MKRLIVAITSLFLLLSCGKTVREEVIERYEDGEKKVVVKYKGSGSNESIIKRRTYDDRGFVVVKEDFENNIRDDNFVNLNPELKTRNGLWRYLQGEWTTIFVEDSVYNDIFLTSSYSALDTLLLGESFRDRIEGNRIYIDEGGGIISEDELRVYDDFTISMGEGSIRFFNEQYNQPTNPYHKIEVIDSDRFWSIYTDTMTISGEETDVTFYDFYMRLD